MIEDKIIQNITKRGVKEIISESEFVELLQSGKKLRLKMGFDPSRADIHLGHVVGLRKLKQLQDLGHEVILIVGDWTAQIGDPSGQSITRPMLTHEDVIANAQSYMDQFFRVVDRNQTQVVWQSEWFGRFSLADVIELTSKFTVAQFLERDDFSLRFKEHKPIAITEFLYPLLQAYDSVAIESDVEFGGTDQMFNLLVGRTLQQIKGMRPQQCFMMPILVGTDGINKMSKSLDNYISLDDTANDMYGKIMSLPDSCIVTYFELLTDLPMQELSEIEQQLNTNAMDAKKMLAHTITKTFFDSQIAGESQQNFEKVVQNKEIPDNIPEFQIATAASLNSVLIESGSVTSNSELKRLFKQNAVQMISNQGDTSNIISDIDIQQLESGTVIKIGKRRYLKLI